MTDPNETETTPPEPDAAASPEPEPAADAGDDDAAAEDAEPEPPAEPALTKGEVIAQGEARTKQMCDDYMAVRKPGQESAQDEQPE